MSDPGGLELDELVEHWAVLAEERELVAGKWGATRLGFALLLKFYTPSTACSHVAARSRLTTHSLS